MRRLIGPAVAAALAASALVTPSAVATELSGPPPPVSHHFTQTRPTASRLPMTWVEGPTFSYESLCYAYGYAYGLAYRHWCCIDNGDDTYTYWYRTGD